MRVRALACERTVARARAGARVTRTVRVCASPQTGACVRLRALDTAFFDEPGVSIVMCEFESPTDEPTAADEPSVEIALPDSIAASAPVRVESFIAGRAVARLALERLRVDATDIAIAHHRGPVWPDGVVGAITHSKHIAAAVVAHATNYVGLGFDSEPVMADTTAAELADSIAPEWLAQFGRAPTALELTVVFSAKESLFKCVRPLVSDFFEFADAAVVAIDMHTGALHLRICRVLAAHVPVGREFTARFALRHASVHTWVAWPVTAFEAVAPTPSLAE